MAIKKNQRYYYSLNNFSISARSTIDGRWKLVRRIGTGGNGEVWQCRDVNDGQEYAIKFLKRAYQEPYSRFYDEERFMEDFGDVPGIMPIIAKYIPPVEKRYADKPKPFYYVMPLAKAIHHDIYAELVENKIRIIRALLEMLVIYKDGVNHSKGVDLSQLTHKEYRGERGGIMHEKFCVIDNVITISGSYNWTLNAENKNDEDASFRFEDHKFASKYTRRFNEMWNRDVM